MDSASLNDHPAKIHDCILNALSKQCLIQAISCIQKVVDNVLVIYKSHAALLRHDGILRTCNSLIPFLQHLLFVRNYIMLAQAMPSQALPFAGTMQNPGDLMKMLLFVVHCLILVPLHASLVAAVELEV